MPRCRAEIREADARRDMARWRRRATGTQFWRRTPAPPPRKHAVARYRCPDFKRASRLHGGGRPRDAAGPLHPTKCRFATIITVPRRRHDEDITIPRLTMPSAESNAIRYHNDAHDEWRHYFSSASSSAASHGTPEIDFSLRPLFSFHFSAYMPLSTMLYYASVSARALMYFAAVSLEYFRFRSRPTFNDRA